MQATTTSAADRYSTVGKNRRRYEEINKEKQHRKHRRKKPSNPDMIEKRKSHDDKASSFDKLETETYDLLPGRGTGTVIVPQTFNFAFSFILLTIATSVNALLLVHV